MSNSQRSYSRTSSSSNRKWLFAWVPVFIMLLGIGIWEIPSSQKIDYNTQVKPIFNKHCISCHGGVKQSGGFSLLNRELALAPTDSEEPAIIPYHPEKSELMSRVEGHDPEYRMPFEKEPLTEEEQGVLKQWISEGAEWGIHWSYKPVEQVMVPSIAEKADLMGGGDSWGQNEVDAFILEGMKGQNLKPNPEAEKAILLRRASMDLIGLSAPQSLADQFLREENPISFEEVLDQLMELPTYGEKWAGMWMDLARYADSKGFERDFSRTIWEYRDYVIRAFNEDLPYDQFVIEQMAGDLLDHPTDAQYIATGFHRNTTTNDEGGTNNEAYRTEAIINRVNTTWEALMGTTFACTQCHGHPYDPIPHESYYQFMAFLNNTRDYDTHMDYPWLRKFSEEDQGKLEELKNWIEKVDGKEKAETIQKFLKTWQPIIYSIETDSMVNAALYDTKYLGFRYKGMARFSNVDLSGKSHLLIKSGLDKKKGSIRIHIDRPDGQKILDSKLGKGMYRGRFYELSIKPTQGTHDLYIYYDNPRLASTPDARGFQFDWMKFVEEFPGKGQEGFAESQKTYWDLLGKSTPHTLILTENPPDRYRTTHVFDRGNWLVPQEAVEADVPKVLPDFLEGAPKNRLGLAKWMVAKNNPLTSRTMVNRIWEQLFGVGLVETLEDLGSQGMTPTHPELLDYLAWSFMHEYEWSIKKLLKSIMSSATYRQSSKVNAEEHNIDPYNRRYARGPRVRLSSEQIRDQALQVSGLLSFKMYGPPVMPYQPEGIWGAPYNSQKWKLSEGEDRYRRAIYTFVKRGSPYPAMETFDVAGRQVCNSRRIRTNTPLQALLTLNDPVFVEAAQHFAQRMQEEGGEGVENQIRTGYQMALQREIPPEKLEVFSSLFKQSQENFEENPEERDNMLGELKEEGNTHLAALVVVANAMMNLDEFLTK